MKKLHFAVAAFALILVNAAFNLHAGILEDGDFSLWTFNNTGSGSQSASREPSGGNPDARLNLTNYGPSGNVDLVGGIKTDFTTTVPFEGEAFTLKLDALGGPGAVGDGQAVAIIVQQGTDYYRRILGVSGTPGSFMTLTFNSTFEAGAFTRYLGSGPTTSDFSSGVPTQFGFAGANSGTPFVITMYYDNFKLDADFLAVPEPGTSAMASLGLITIVAMAARRRNQQRRR